MPKRTPAAGPTARRAPAAKTTSREAADTAASAAPRTASKGAAKKSAVKPRAARRAPAPLSAADVASLRELTARLGELKVPGLAARFIAGWRADLGEIIQSNRRSYGDLRATARRQFDDAIGELQTLAKLMVTVGAKESARNLHSLVLASLQLVLADARELAGLAANSQRASLALVRARVARHVEDIQRLLRK